MSVTRTNGTISHHLAAFRRLPAPSGRLLSPSSPFTCLSDVPHTVPDPSGYRAKASAYRAKASGYRANSSD